MTARKQALLTGGKSGLGLACAIRLRHDGIEVLTLDVNLSADHVVDITDSPAVSRAFETIGTVDILINSDGIARASTALLETTDEVWERTIRVNDFGTFIVSKAVIPATIRRGSGRVVNVTSIAVTEGNANQGA